MWVVVRTLLSCGLNVDTENKKYLLIKIKTNKKGRLSPPLVTPLPESVITDVFVHIGFQVVGLGAEDGLHAGASDDYAGCAQFLQARLVNF